MAFRVFMSSGTGWRMISWKNGSLRWILLSHRLGSSGLCSFHQNSVRSATSDDAAGRAALVLVDQRDRAMKSRRIWLRSRVRTPPRPPLWVWISSFRMNSESDFPSTSSRD